MTDAETFDFLNALLLAFSAFGSVIGVGSASLAFYQWVMNGLRMPYVSDALTLGVVLSFLPALTLGGMVFDSAYGGTL